MSNKNDRWSALSMKERADLMNMYITNGISDLKEMKRHYNSFSPGGFMSPINPIIIEEQLVKKPLRNAAYRFGSDEEVQQKGYAGINDVLRILSPKYQVTNPMDDNKTTFLYGNVNGLPPANNSNGKDFSEYIKSTYPTKDVKSYQGVINPFDEYIIDNRDKGLIEELVKKGKDLYINADTEYVNMGPNDFKYRDDVASYNAQFVNTNRGPAISAADLYDFGPDYNPAKYNEDLSKTDSFLGNLESKLFSYVGTPYILRQDNIPIRFIDYNNASSKDIDRANMLKAAITHGMLSKKDVEKGIDLDSKLAEVLGNGYIEPSVVTAESKKAKRGKLNSFSGEEPIYGGELEASIITPRQSRINKRRMRKELFTKIKSTLESDGDIIQLYNELPEDQRKRVLESIMKFSSAADPKIVKDWFIEEAKKHPLKAIKALNYVITGEGQPVLFEPNRKYAYNGLFGGDYYFDKQPPIDNGIIDAMLYNREINSNIGVQANKQDYGPEVDYINRVYPDKNIQYIETKPGIDLNQEGIQPTIYYGAEGSFRTSLPNRVINNAGIIIQEGVRNDSTFVRGLDVYDFKPDEYMTKWVSDPSMFHVIKQIDEDTNPVAIKTPWVYKDDINDIISSRTGLNGFEFNTIDNNKSVYKTHKSLGGKLNSFSGEESFVSKVHKYPEVTIKEEPWADAYFKQHPEIAGMAIGAGLNGVGGPRRVIINPYSKNINKDAVLLNERSRHYMEESNFKLPKVTDEQMKKYEGTPYQNDTLNVGRTEAARFISGDKHLLTPEQIEYINSYSRGGRILDGTEVEQTLSGEPLYYDDTYIEPAVVKAFNSQEDYNKYYGEQFGRQVARGMNSAAPYVLEAAMLPFDIAGIAEAPMLIYKGVKHVPKLMKGLKDLPTKVKISNKKLGKLFDFADTKMPIKEGSESVVYIGDDKVFKVPSEGSPEMTLDELAEFNKNYISKRNAPPHTAPLAVEGVVKGSTKGKYYPVYSQQKLNVVGEDTMPFWEWEKHRALLDEKMAKSGWPDIGGAYYNKDLNLHVGDIKPSNVAYDNKGNLLIIDGDVYGNGGKLLTKNKK